MGAYKSICPGNEVINFENPQSDRSLLSIIVIFFPSARLCGVGHESRRELILLNFTLDIDNSLLSHQADVVKALAQRFQKVTVITGNVGNFDCPHNVDIINLHWAEGKKIGNLFRLYKSFLSVLLPGRTVVFSHMADVQSAFLSPITWISRTPHYLWYAHKHLSPYLKFASYFITGVMTSTSGSCPLSGEKISVIGQGVDPTIFESQRKVSNPLEKCVHIGRADPSKNLKTLFEFARFQHDLNPNFKLIQVGSPSTFVAKLDFENLCKQFEDLIRPGIIDLRSSTPRDRVPSLLANADLFVHAYEGSLDKTLVESTLARVPVITSNREYHEIFGTWSGEVAPTLKSEYQALKKLTDYSLEKEVERRFQIAEESHSFTRWIDRISKILQKS